MLPRTEHAGHHWNLLIRSGIDLDQSEALRRFLVEPGIGHDGRFWRLALAICQLYPRTTGEERWVHGILGRKKGLGF